MNKCLSRSVVVLFALVLAFVVAGCSIYFINWNIINGSPLVEPDEEYSLKSVFPSSQRWPQSALRSIHDKAKSMETTAVIAIHDGHLVAEWGKTNKRISAHSVRKSLMSALYGIAVQKGLIDINSTLEELGIDDVNPFLSKEEKQARVVDLLKARSGIYHDSVRAGGEKDRPERGSHPPGTSYYYNNWSFNALGTIFEQSTEMKMGEAFKQWVGDPIEMQDFRAEDVRYTYSEESVFPAYRFWISARDLARFGMLYLNEGRWGNQQVLSKEWISISTKKYSDAGQYGYGYMWWTLKDGAYFASGTGGQRLLIDPKRRLMILVRVDTGEPGLERVLWLNFGPRVGKRKFLKFTNHFITAIPSIE